MSSRDFIKYVARRLLQASIIIAGAKDELANLSN